MNAPPFPTNPFIGQRFGNWAWNGVRWVSTQTTGIAVITTTFTASGSYMPSPGLVSLVVECIGGGGAGGGINVFDFTGVVALAGGGGSGGYSRKTLPASLVLGGVAVTIGAGGGPASDGLATTFGALCAANGGSQAQGFILGPGAAPGMGDVAMPGSCGAMGLFMVVPTGAVDWSDVIGGMGGVMWGGNGVNPVGPGAVGVGGDAYPNTGAGGGGAAANQGNVTAFQNGGSGGSGVCIVTEYCWADGNEDDCLTPPINVNARVAVTHVPWTGPGPCPPGWSDDGC